MSGLQYHNVGRGPFDAFLTQRDDREDGDFLAARVFDRDVNLQPFLRQGDTLPYTDSASRERWLNEQLRPILDRLQEKRRCVFCNVEYKNIDNIGRWQCVWHPLPLQPDNTYECCGRPGSTRGCKPCDHSPSYDVTVARWDTHNTLIDIPTAVTSELRPKKEAYKAEGVNTRNPARSLFRIQRAKF